MEKITRNNPLLLLGMLLLAWVLLGVQFAQPKTASGPFFESTEHHLGVTRWKAAPRLGLDAWTTKIASGDSVVPKGNANALRYVDEPAFNPAGTAGAAQPWTNKARIKHVELPTSGKIRYVPPENYNPSNPLPRGPNNGYLDKFGNEWTKGPSRTAGQAFEWDVQLSRQGKSQLGWATRDGSHLNVSLDGKITHK